MKRSILTAILIYLLSACGLLQNNAALPFGPGVSATEPTTIATEPATIATEPAPSLYLPGYSADDVVRYFNEVCLDAEFTTGTGNPSLLQKWGEPITCALYGDYTPEDVAIIQGFADWLNTIEGFPGMTLTADGGNLSFYFCPEAEMIERLGENFYGCDGGVTFWYQNNEIYEGIICCRNDLDRSLRNSVILEELYNGLGPVQDTALRPDSIIYSEFSTPQALTDMDKLLLQLLYHPSLECGMDAATCETIIRQLYTP